MSSQEFLKRLGFEHPIVQGPLGGGPSTPELVAAVSNAGGLGSLGAAYLTPQQITDAVRRIRALTARPFNVNLFAGGWSTNLDFDAGPMIEVLAEAHEKLGISPPIAPTPAPDPFPSQLEAVLDARPPIFSFTFGIPDRDAMSRLKSRGIVILGTATTVEEARQLEQAGVDAIVAQGLEAGAHRGTFLGSFESSMVPTLDLVRATVAAVSVPVIATGGLMDGRDIVAAFDAGASAAQLGTAFLPCPESGATDVYKQALLAAKKDTTVVTRAFSRTARARSPQRFHRPSGRSSKSSPALSAAERDDSPHAQRRRAARSRRLPVSLGWTGRCTRASDACRRLSRLPGK